MRERQREIERGSGHTKWCAVIFIDSTKVSPLSISPKHFLRNTPTELTTNRNDITKTGDSICLFVCGSVYVFGVRVWQWMLESDRERARKRERKRDSEREREKERAPNLIQGDVSKHIQSKIIVEKFLTDEPEPVGDRQ